MAKITPQEAIARLIPSPKRGRLMAPSNNDIQLEYNGTLGDKELLYVINNNTEGKSYLCPADDQLNPIITEFNGIVELDEDASPVFQDLIKSYENQIYQLQNMTGSDDSITGADEQYILPDNVPNSVTPLFEGIIWNQRWPFNCKFPYIKLPTPNTNYLYQPIKERENEEAHIHPAIGCPNVTLGQNLYYFWKKFGVPFSIDASKVKGKKCEFRFRNDGDTGWVTTNYSWNLDDMKSTENVFETNFRDSYANYYVVPTKEEGRKDENSEKVSEFLAYLAIIQKCFFTFTFTRSNNVVTGISRGGYIATSNYPGRFLGNCSEYINTSPFEGNYQGIFDLTSAVYTEVCDYLIQKLNNKIPSIIGFDQDIVNNVDEGSGHVANLDGYKIENGVIKFHINMGWNDTSKNTYYPLTAVDPYVNKTITTRIQIYTIEPKDGIIIDNTLYGDVNQDEVIDNDDVICAVKKVHSGQYVKEGDIDKDNIFSEQDIERVYDKCQEHSDLATKINYVYKIKRLTNNIETNLQDININLNQK